MRSIRAHRAADLDPFTVTYRDGMVEIARPVTNPPAGRALTWSDANRLSQIVRAELSDGATSIVIDLDGGESVDTSLVAVLVDAEGAARRRGAVLVMHASPALRRLAAVCRLEGLLHFT